jgi:hypothetical protein
VGYCEHGNEPSGFVNVENHLDHVSDWELRTNVYVNWGQVLAEKIRLIWRIKGRVGWGGVGWVRAELQASRQWMEVNGQLEHWQPLLFAYPHMQFFCNFVPPKLLLYNSSYRQSVTYV